jgi:hypothetical protein
MDYSDPKPIINILEEEIKSISSKFINQPNSEENRQQLINELKNAQFMQEPSYIYAPYIPVQISRPVNFIKVEFNIDKDDPPKENKKSCYEADTRSDEEKRIADIILG